MVSFADELRNAPKEKEKQKQREAELEQERQKREFVKFIKQFYKHIKRECKKRAESGYDQYSVALGDVIYGLQKFPSDYDYELRGTWEKITDYISREGEWCRFVHLTKEDAEFFVSQIEEYCKNDGLSLSYSLRETEETRTEKIWVERGKKAKIGVAVWNLLFLDSDLNEEGYYKYESVFDHYSYDIEFVVKW